MSVKRSPIVDNTVGTGSIGVGNLPHADLQLPVIPISHPKSYNISKTLNSNTPERFKLIGLQ